MTVAAFSKCLAAVAGTAVVTHLLIATAISLSLHVLYPRRIFDARKWPGGAVEGLRLVGTYLREQIDGSTPVLMFAGSSVTFGYPFHERLVFSRLVADRAPNVRVLNASIIAADISGVNDWIICAARRNGMRVGSLVVELPVVNTLNQLSGLRRAGHPGAAPLNACDAADEDRGYFDTALRRPLGLGWLPFLWNGDRQTEEGVVRPVPVPKGYFTSAADFVVVRGEFERHIVATLRTAQVVAQQVYAFPSPVFVAGLSEVGEDAQAMSEQLVAARVACSMVAGVHCLDPSAFYGQRAYFFNFTHLNQAGHRAMADWFQAELPH